ncbi:hypothetical protein PSUB009319_28520 [Ralstonia sp. SET104]|nr:hypothetical protein PSUB009319_28520 [Ralstonia sp. SET104]
MTKTKSLYHGHRFPAAVISHAVRRYFRFNLSLRDIEELLFERGWSFPTRQFAAGVTNLAPAMPIA